MACQSHSYLFSEPLGYGVSYRCFLHFSFYYDSDYIHCSSISSRGLLAILHYLTHICFDRLKFTWITSSIHISNMFSFWILLVFHVWFVIVTLYWIIVPTNKLEYCTNKWTCMIVVKFLLFILSFFLGLLNYMNIIIIFDPVLDLYSLF